MKISRKPRSSDWNYGGKKWKLSRSKIDLFTECPRCFYFDNKFGLPRPKFPAFTLNTAVDTLLKKEFDYYRNLGQAHPIMEEYGIDAVPFKHKDLDLWRDNFTGLQYTDSQTKMTISGAIDDLWINSKGELIVVDYKSTSKEQEITLDDEWKEGYKRQMEVYQWLLRKLGFEVAETGYFVYANADTTQDKFDAKLEFNMSILAHTGNTDWIDSTIDSIKETLDSAKIPEQGERCEYCPYCFAREDQEKK